jgi:F-type H+-transporting ATPase subunit delta
MSSDDSQSGSLPFEPTPSIEDLHVGRIYANALLNAAAGQNAVDDVLGELNDLVGEVFRSEPQIEQFLTSGIISEEEKEKVLTDVFRDRGSPLFYQFLMVACKHGRLGLLRAIRQEFLRLNDQRLGRLPIQVRSAVPLPDDQRDRLYQGLRNALGLEPVLDLQVDPAILGGLIVRVGDWLFDRSVRTELRNIEKQLLSKSSSAIRGLGERIGTIGE